MSAERPWLPPHTRLILASEDLLEQWGARTSDGYALSAEWGEKKIEGWYEPTFTAHYDQPLPAVAEARQQVGAGLVAELVGAEALLADGLARLGRVLSSLAILDGGDA